MFKATQQTQIVEVQTVKIINLQVIIPNQQDLPLLIPVFRMNTSLHLINRLHILQLITIQMHLLLITQTTIFHRPIHLVLMHDRHQVLIIQRTITKILALDRHLEVLDCQLIHTSRTITMEVSKDLRDFLDFLQRHYFTGQDFIMAICGEVVDGMTMMIENGVQQLKRPILKIKFQALTSYFLLQLLWALLLHLDLFHCSP